MRFATFSKDQGCALAVQSSTGAQLDLTAAGIADDLLGLIDRWPSLRDRIASLVADPGDCPQIAPGSQLIAPIPHPRRNIFCVGKNYREHAKEFGQSGFDGGATGGNEVPEYPIIFSKATTSVIGPEAPVPSSADPYGTIDYEGELGVIIGTGGKAIDRAAAAQHVFGYTIINDVTAREVQKRHKQWVLGKGADGFCPMGPAVVTADDIDDVHALRLTTHVNGELRQDAVVADLIFDIPTLIETISRYITLLPGDIIATGTPAGVGIGFDPPRFLRPGDTVTVAISGIGELGNPID
jgi:2-keto-4-pentenoate hydratase/2-oxohepta-3-ene-1,7-dioic acid hydratase in catechol pathway